jgi:hypothetical protein
MDKHTPPTNIPRKRKENPHQKNNNIQRKTRHKTTKIKKSTAY